MQRALGGFARSGGAFVKCRLQAAPVAAHERQAKSCAQANRVAGWSLSDRMASHSGKTDLAETSAVSIRTARCACRL